MYTNSQYDLVRDFHNKFGLSYQGPPRKLPDDEQKFRIKCLHEELHEYEEAVEIGDSEGELDALIDLVYFALGTAHRNGYDFDTGFNRVHFANMQKRMLPDRQRRGFHLEINKPDGWIPPNLSSLVMPARSPRNSEDIQMSNLCGLVTIDGVDSSGKTSLAKRIVEMTDGEYIHLTWSPELEKVMESYRTGALMYAANLAKEKVVVLERPVLSHVVYSNVYRNGEMVDDAVIEHWLELISDSCVDIMSLPGSRKHWFDLYIEMTRTRDELYAADDDEKMKEVFNQFKLISNSGNSKIPEVVNPQTQYDMFNMQDPIDIDNWIGRHVISNLNTKEQ